MAARRLKGNALDGGALAATGARGGSMRLARFSKPGRGWRRIAIQARSVRASMRPSFSAGAHSVLRRPQARRTRAVVCGGGTRCKSLCFPMCAGSATWRHFSAKTLLISANGLIRSESGRQSPVPRARPRTVPVTTLNRIRCPAFTRVFPKNRYERTASEISPGTKKFFCKNVFHTKATPFMRARTIFGQVFVRGGMNKISKWKVPPSGGAIAR